MRQAQKQNKTNTHQSTPHTNTHTHTHTHTNCTHKNCTNHITHQPTQAHAHILFSFTHMRTNKEEKSYSTHTQTNTQTSNHGILGWALLQEEAMLFSPQVAAWIFFYQWRVWFFERCRGPAYCQIWRDVCLISHEYRWFLFPLRLWTSFFNKNIFLVLFLKVSASLESVRSRSGGKEIFPFFEKRKKWLSVKKRIN